MLGLDYLGQWASYYVEIDDNLLEIFRMFWENSIGTIHINCYMIPLAVKPSDENEVSDFAYESEVE